MTMKAFATILYWMLFKLNK